MIDIRETKSTHRQSAKIQIDHGAVLERIRAALEKETRVNLHRYPIKLAFSDGDAVLTGELENVAAKKLAHELAAAVAPATGLVDRLKVTPAQAMSDAELRDHTIKLLLDEPALEHCQLHSRLPDQLQTHRNGVPEPSGTIVVEVRNGVITLNGEVPSLSHKRLAGVLAWWVPGCRDVVNGLPKSPSSKTTTMSSPTQCDWCSKRIPSSMPRRFTSGLKTASSLWTDWSPTRPCEKWPSTMLGWYWGSGMSSTGLTSNREEQEEQTCQPMSFAAINATSGSSRCGRCRSTTVN